MASTQRLKMDSGSLPEQDDIWCFMQQSNIGSQFKQFEEGVEESDFNDGIFDPNSEEASCSSSELAENSPHLKSLDSVKGLLAESTKRSGNAVPAAVEKVKAAQRHISPVCSPNASYLGKRDRNHETKAGGKWTTPKEKARAAVAKESRWAEQLLNSCAEAIASNNIHRTQHLMWVLNDLGCLTGDANQRLAAYGLKALFSKIAGTVAAASAYHENLSALRSSLTPKGFHKALLKFHDVNPWHQMIYTVTNGVLVDAFEGKHELHVIDIGVSQGTQWPTLIEALATRPSGPPNLLRLTIVEDPWSVLSPHTATEVKSRLERFAKVMGLNMELRVLASSLESLTKESFELNEGEALAVCTQFRLGKTNETQEPELLTEGDARDKFLKFLFAELEPEVMILGDNDSDHMKTDFVAFFYEVINHFWKFLDSMSSAFKGQDCEERQIIEHLFSMAMINSVACQMQKNETHTSWNRRVENAGFLAETPHEEITETVRMLLKKNDSNWDLANHENCMVLLWKQQPVTFCSVWKC